MSFKQILLALDRTQKADVVLEQGVSLATKYDACLHLIHCVDDAKVLATASPITPVGTGMSWTGTSLSPGGMPLTTADPAQNAMASETLDRQLAAARDWLVQYQQKAYDAGCEETVSTLKAGSPGDCICQVAEELDADLIVVGRKDRSGFEELLLGSVSSKVIHHAPCAVLVTPT